MAIGLADSICITFANRASPLLVTKIPLFVLQTSAQAKLGHEYCRRYDPSHRLWPNFPCICFFAFALTRLMISVLLRNFDYCDSPFGAGTCTCTPVERHWGHVLAKVFALTIPFPRSNYRQQRLSAVSLITSLATRLALLCWLHIIDLRLIAQTILPIRSYNL